MRNLSKPILSENAVVSLQIPVQVSNIDKKFVKTRLVKLIAAVNLYNG